MFCNLYNYEWSLLSLISMIIKRYLSNYQFLLFCAFIKTKLPESSLYNIINYKILTY